MPTRLQAVRKLYDLINSGILAEDLEQDLRDIANCIEAEENLGIFLWGADDDYIDLYIVKREDLITDEWLKHLDEVYEKYRIKAVR